MIFPFGELPDDLGLPPRPVVDVSVADMDEAQIRCLVDSGSLNTLLPGWVADAAGIPLAGCRSRHLGVAGTAVEARMATTALNVAGYAWEAEVGFCEPWHLAWGILGQQSFFRYFTVTFRAVEFRLELVPVVA